MEQDKTLEDLREFLVVELSYLGFQVLKKLTSNLAVLDECTDP